MGATGWFRLVGWKVGAVSSPSKYHSNSKLTGSVIHVLNCAGLAKGQVKLGWQLLQETYWKLQYSRQGQVGRPHPRMHLRRLGLNSSTKTRGVECSVASVAEADLQPNAGPSNRQEYTVVKKTDDGIMVIQSIGGAGLLYGG